METWKAIKGYEGKYEVSNLGRVRSLRWGKPNTPNIPRETPLILSPSIHPYPKVALHKDRHKKSFFVHRLVLEAFVGPCPPKHEAAHLDGNPSNAELTNLKWVTGKENMSHTVIHGTRMWGSKHYASNLTEAQVKQIRELRDKEGLRYIDLAKMFNANIDAIGAIVRRQNWKHI